MITLSKVQAENAIFKLKPHFTKALARNVELLLELLDTEGKVTVGKIHEELFALNKAAAANVALNRLITAVNEVFAAAGSSVCMQISSDKKLGTAREVWFETEEVSLPKPYTKELDAIDPSALEVTQQAVFAESADVVLLTFNSHELQQALSHFCPATKPGCLNKDGRLFYQLGTFGGNKVVLLHSEQATIKTLRSAEAAISAWQPKAVIAMGIAFGMDSNKQRIGDVLISEYLIPYELARVNHDGSETLRSARPPASAKLIRAFKNLDTHITANGIEHFPRLQFGGIFSGDKLLDNYATREKLKKLVPEAVGGEMEGAGLYEAVEPHSVHWIIVKAICDFADGNKNSRNKEQDQIKAAQHAAMVVKAALELGQLYVGDQGSQKSHRAERKLELAADQFSPKASDLNNMRLEQTICDAQAVRSAIDKVQQPDSTANDGLPVQNCLLDWLNNDDKDVFALLGEYGMGKTINCQLFDRTLRERHQQDKTQPISLYFDLRNVAGLSAKEVPPIDSVIRDCVTGGWFSDDEHKVFTLADIERWARQYGVVFIFDGLDEVLVKLVGNAGQLFTNQLLKLLVDFKRRLQGAKKVTKLLLSCRTQYFKTLHTQIDHFTGQERGGYKPERIEAMVLLPFNEQQVQRYLQHSLPGINPAQVLEMISSVHDLTDLSKRPYTLKLVTEFIPQLEERYKQGLSVNGVSLYRMVAQRWLDRDGGKHHIKPEHKLLLASHLAAYLWRQGQRALDVSNIEDWLHQWFDERPQLAARYRNLDADLLEEDLRTATFLSREDTTQGSRFRFAHSSLQEYFLATYLLQAIADNQPQNWNLSKPSHETLVFLAQLLAEPENALLVDKLNGWKSVYRPQVSENLLFYAVVADKLGFSVPNLNGINLATAQLDDLVLEKHSKLSLNHADFSNTSLRRFDVQGLSLANSVFEGANLTQAIFSNCNLSSSHWANANLTSSTFNRCNIKDIDDATSLQLHTAWLDCEPPVKAMQLPNQIIALKPEGSQLQLISKGHQDSVTNLLVLMDGKTLASTGEDGSIRLWDVAGYQCLAVLEGHQSEVMRLIELANGMMLASAGADGTVRLWDTAGYQCLTVLKGHQGMVRQLVMLDDGVILASAGADGTVRLWDTAGYQCLAVLKGHQGSVRQLSVLGDGVTLASAGDDGMVRLWDTADYQCLAMLEGHQSWVRQLVVLGDGVTLASAADDGVVRLWDTAGYQCLAVLEVHQNGVTQLAVLGDGVTLASAGDDGSVRLWDTAGYKCLAVLEGHKYGVMQLAMLGDGETLVSAAGDGTVRLWDTAGYQCLAVLEGHRYGVMQLVVLRDGLTLASAGGGGSIFLWDTVGYQCLAVLEGHHDWARQLVVLGNGVTLASAGADGSVRLWDTAGYQCLAMLEGHQHGVTQLAVLGDGVTLVSAGGDGTVRLWNTAANRCLAVLEGHHDWVMDLAVLGDGVTLASAGDDGTVRLWDTVDYQCLAVLEGHQKGVMGLVVLGDGVTLVSSGFDSVIKLWDSVSYQCLAVLEGHDDWVGQLVVLGDGVTLASAGDDGTVRLWDTSSYQCLAALEGHQQGVTQLVVLGDGVTLASAGVDGTVRLWDTVNYKCLEVLEGHQEWVGQLAVLGDGVTLASAGEDGTIRLWDTVSYQCLAVLEGHHNGLMQLKVLGDGVTLASVGMEGVRLQDTASGKGIARFYHFKNGNFAIFDEQKQRVTSASDDAWRYLAYLTEIDGQRVQLPFFIEESGNA